MCLFAVELNLLCISSEPCMDSQSAVEDRITALEKSGNATINEINQIKASLNKLTDLPNFYREKYTHRLDQLRDVTTRKRVIPPRTRRAPTHTKAKLNERTEKSTTEPSETEACAQTCAENSVVKEEECTTSNLVFTDPRTDLKLSNLTNSTVTASNVESSVYCANVYKSKLHISCQQCRLYNCHDVEIYLNKCTHPVIELSTNITFYANGPLSVSDFQWPNPVLPSPNFIVKNDHQALEKQ